VLVPLVLTGVNQQRNAEQLAHHGAAVIVADNQLADDLARVVVELLNQGERRKAMAQAAVALAQPDAARKIANVLVEMVAKG
jgi:UDP-N-acetylglucosamine--N-acetylmuramyl-(pentapeptide) pyrophosphoryl-undecaprenol N-acetylglucosamine transferase